MSLILILILIFPADFRIEGQLRKGVTDEQGEAIQSIILLVCFKEITLISLNKCLYKEISPGAGFRENYRSRTGRMFMNNFLLL